MYRSLFAAAVAVVALALCVTEAVAGGPILDKKEKLTDKDPGYKPGSGVDQLPQDFNPKGAPADFAPQFFKFITNNPHKVYTTKLTKGDKIVIELKSKDFDAVVIVEDAKNKVLAFNDDDPEGGGTLDSRLVWTVPADGEYRIIATSLNKKSGDFELKITKAAK
jgi:hypothetical protein